MSVLSDAQPAEAQTCAVPSMLSVELGATPADQLAQDREDWLTLRAAMRHIRAAYAPVDARGWPSEISVEAKVLEHGMNSIRAGARLSEAEQGIERAAKAYGAWQEQVTWAESENCSRLIGLIWCATTAERIGETRGDNDTRMMGALLRKTIRDWYGVESWPTGYAELRRWAQCKTRQYKAMPKDWRGL